MAELKSIPASNRKPADELADIREQIRLLKVREESLRARFLSGTASLTGDEYKVVVTSKTSERLNTRKLRKELGLNFLKPFLQTVETDYVRLKKLSGEDIEQDDGDE